jgi:group II intron reverse transcriptase/maturase
MLWILQDRGSRGLCLERVYRLLFDTELHLSSYGKIYRNFGAMTRGATNETADGMSLEKVHRIIEALRRDRFKWTPVKRVYIPKKNGKLRPLGLPTWSDKLVQESLRVILEAYYEPQFSDHSFGFRPNRGCQSALTRIARTWTGTAWFIEGDIAGCFDNIHHTTLLDILRDRIHDGRFLHLVAGLLQAGYLEDWRYNATLSGSPQGGIVSPILANIYLDRLDKFVEATLLPEYNRGEQRRFNQAYHNLQKMAARRKRDGDIQGYRECMRRKGAIPSKDPNDPNYRRLRYARYADDFLLGFAGPKREAEEIKERLRLFLRDELKLSLSPEKTLITHARTQKARFLGYDICVSHNDDHKVDGVRKSNGGVCLLVPAEVIAKKLTAFIRDGRIAMRSELLNERPLDIVARFQAEWRGIVQYYQLAWNLNVRLGRLFYVMNVSLAKTLAVKLHISAKAVFDTFKAEVETPYGPRKVLLVRERRQDGERVSYFGGLNLVRSRVGEDCDPPAYLAISRPAELVDRLLAGRCEMCGLEGPCMVHQVRSLADLRRSMTADPPRWVRFMVGRNRKTLVLCRRCFQDIKHTPRLSELSQHRKAGCDESRMSGLEEDCGKSTRLGE